MTKREQIFFTIVDEETGEEKRVNIDFCEVLRHQPTRINFPKVISIGSQQLAELGHLFIALSQHDYDYDSVQELIEGYGYKKIVVSKSKKFTSD